MLSNPDRTMMTSIGNTNEARLCSIRWPLCEIEVDNSSIFSIAFIILTFEINLSTKLCKTDTSNKHRQKYPAKKSILF